MLKYLMSLDVKYFWLIDNFCEWWMQVSCRCRQTISIKIQWNSI